MARFDVSQLDNYKPQSNGSFFGLANDGDYEQVRLMYNDMNDVEFYSVHEIEIDGNKYWVNCLREYDQPVDDCPLCKAANKLNVKLWVPLYIPNSQEVKIWERGRTFASKLESSARRFSPLCSNIFEIERNGKKGDQNTTYELIHISKDDTKLEELPELPKVEGTIVKTLSFEQMEEYLKTGKVTGLREENSTKTRNPETDRRPAANNEQTVVRRTARRVSGTQSDVF